MNAEFAGEIRIELDYGRGYLLRAFKTETSNRSIAIEKIIEARMIKTNAETLKRTTIRRRFRTSSLLSTTSITKNIKIHAAKM